MKEASMFTRQECELVIEALEGELEFLSKVSKRGVPTIRQKAAVASLQAKCASEIERLAKVEAEAAKQEKQA